MREDRNKYPGKLNGVAYLVLLEGQRPDSLRASNTVPGALAQKRERADSSLWRDLVIMQVSPNSNGESINYQT